MKIDPWKRIFLLEATLKPPRLLEETNELLVSGGKGNELVVPWKNWKISRFPW